MHTFLIKTQKTNSVAKISELYIKSNSRKNKSKIQNMCLTTNKVHRLLPKWTLLTNMRLFSFIFTFFLHLSSVFVPKHFYRIFNSCNNERSRRIYCKFRGIQWAMPAFRISIVKCCPPLLLRCPTSHACSVGIWTEIRRESRETMLFSSFLLLGWKDK